MDLMLRFLSQQSGDAVQGRRGAAGADAGDWPDQSGRLLSGQRRSDLPHSLTHLGDGTLTDRVP